MDQKIHNVLFEPHINVPPERRGETRFEETSSGVYLGVVVQQLVSATNLLHSELPLIESLIGRSAVVKHMSTSELRKVSGF